GGFRNAAELVLVGRDVEAKAAWVRTQLEAALKDPPASVEWSLARTDREDADTEEAASSRLRVTVRDPSPDRVGKAFTAPLVELALASYPGFTLTAPPAPGTPYGVYRPAYVDRDNVSETVHLPDGTSSVVAPPAELSAAAGALAPSPPDNSVAAGPTRRVPLGVVAHARSGDKGGDANIGVWARDGRDDRAAWLTSYLTPERVRALLPEAAALDVEVHRLPNLRAVNVVVHGLLGEGVAASSRFDPQAKALGEWLRSRHVDVPEALL
ncbi:MAG: exopolyphosphatase, partial [Nocardioidaceae bacterium]|nr:exopolyphosphatase [Nocardioidaceae bacterium]